MIRLTHSRPNFPVRPFKSFWFSKANGTGHPIPKVPMPWQFFIETDATFLRRAISRLFLRLFGDKDRWNKKSPEEFIVYWFCRRRAEIKGRAYP